MSNPIAELLAKELVKIYTQRKLPHYARLNAVSAEGFNEERIKRDPGNSLFQMIILAAYDRMPFTRWAGGFEPIWGLVKPKQSLPDILRTAQLFTLSSVLDLEEGAIDGILTGCFFYGHHLASYGEIRYATTFKKAADLVSSLLSDIRSARTATDVKRFHSNLDSIPGIGETIASKLVMYTFRELPYFGSSIHPGELYPAVKPILKEYHNANLAGELKNHYGNDIVEEIFKELKGLGDPFAIDALYYVDRDEPGLKTCLLRMANCKETEMGKDDSSTLAVTLPPQKMELLKKIAKDEYDVDKCTLAKIWIIERLQQYRHLAMSSSAPAPPSGDVDIDPTAKMIEKKYQFVIPESKRDLFPDTKGKITVVFEGKQYERTYNPTYGEISLREIYKFGISVGDTVRITPRVSKMEYLVQVIKKITYLPTTAKI